MNEYKYIKEQVIVRDNYRNGIINLNVAIDKLIEFGYAYEEAKEFLNKEVKDILIWVEII